MKKKTIKVIKKKLKPILLFIRVIIISKTSKRIISKDIDEIIKGLNRLYIL